MPVQRKHNFFFIQTLTSLFMLFLVLLSAPVKASIVITGTRVIYSQGERSVSVKLNNNGKSPVLIQSWVDDGVMSKSPDTSTAPFIVTPPINRVDPGKGQTLQITFTGKKLPSDKESVFWLNVLEVPARNSSKKDDNFLQIAFRTRIKLFYRPQALQGKYIEAPDNLEWKTVDGKLLAANKTPWYVSVSGVSANGKKTAGKMIAPFNAESFPLRVSHGQMIHFDVVNDYGAVTEKSAEVK